MKIQTKVPALMFAFVRTRANPKALFKFVEEDDQFVSSITIILNLLIPLVPLALLTRHNPP